MKGTERDRGVGPHHPKRSDTDSISHGVTLAPDTRLAQLGADLVLPLQSDDGLIEGFESKDGRLVGVQFHPEKLPGTTWDALFTDLVEKANG